MAGLGIIGVLILMALAMVVLGLTIAYVLVPVFKGIGWTIAGLFRGIAWLIGHLAEFIGGMISDALRLVGAVLAAIVLTPFVPLNVILGRWSGAGHFSESIKREIKVAGSCIYRIALRRPLKLLWLHGILEGVEQRLPEAMAAAPTSDKPRRRTGQFDGYRIVGSLPGGGSGAKLYIAEPEAEARKRHRDLPDRVVIKAFALTEGSSLPQIIRESRALESAKQLGLVLDHGLDDHRFFYIMPYHPGEHLGVLTRQLHGQSDGRGLDERSLHTVMGYVGDLLQTLAVYHRGGLWHKDVKPENVIVHSGHAHLVDLGLVTPLRSAMTLTTHGTEYFRDPEMVRQALRGVKVHQVDGTKFDVYAVGAVLYYMIENTFPAHGGLSRFSKKSPEALRWIVRRAMADYNQRYGSADEMVADLAVIAGAADVYAIRPVDLPSMRSGHGSPPPAHEPPVEHIAAVGMMPPPLPIDASYAPDAPAAPAPGPDARRAPRLRVTNWWTGAYVAEEAGEGTAPAPAMDARMFREQARAAQEQAREMQRQVQAGALSARKAAREQIKSARARARDMRRRARTHRHKAVAERQPSPMVAGIVVMLLLVIGAGVLLAVKVHDERGRVTQWAHAESTVVTVEADASDAIDQPRLMLVMNDDYTRDPYTMLKVKGIMGDLQQDYDVLFPPSTTVNEHAIALLEASRQQPDSDAADRLEMLMDDMDLDGIEWITMNHSEGERWIEPLLITSRSADDTAIAQVVSVTSVTPQGKLLLLNDHPAKSDPRVAREVEGTVAAYRDRNWDVLVDDDAEAAVRKVLPPGRTDSVPTRLYVLLEELGLSGVLVVDASGGEGAPHDRVTVTRIDAESPELIDVNGSGPGMF